MNPYRKSLFATTIFHDRIKQNDKLKEVYIPKIEDIHSNVDVNIPDGWDTGNVYTTFDQLSLNQQVFDDEIVLCYQQHIAKFFDQPVEFFIKDLWFNYYENGEYQEQHNHLNADIFNSWSSHFGCIHYLKFDPEVHIPAIFVDPCDTLRYNCLEMQSNGYTSKYLPKVAEGDIIMFPTYLEHYVKQTKPTPGNPRITVSFNIVVTRYGDRQRDTPND